MTKEEQIAKRRYNCKGKGIAKIKMTPGAATASTSRSKSQYGTSEQTWSQVLATGDRRGGIGMYSYSVICFSNLIT
jgi:hypothetical protein